MKRYLLLPILLAACMGPPPPPTIVNVGGVDGIQVGAAKMLGTAEPTPENVAATAAQIETGDHGAGLKRVAGRYCDNGFRVLRRNEPKASIYVFKPRVQYRVSRSFVIACT